MPKIVTICAEYNRELVSQLYDQAKEGLLNHKSLAKRALSKWTEKNQMDLKSESLQQIGECVRQRENFESYCLRTGRSQGLHQLALYLEQSAHLESERVWVPGAGEIPLTVQWLAERLKPQAILALGVIIKGKSSHYDFLCGFLQRALWDLQKVLGLPIVFSVLMVENRKQAIERIHQRKRGAESMKSLLDLLELNHFLGDPVD